MSSPSLGMPVNSRNHRQRLRQPPSLPPPSSIARANPRSVNTRELLNASARTRDGGLKLFRSYNDGKSDHFYTVSEQEGNDGLEGGWHYKRVAAYISPFYPDFEIRYRP
jgi:hypothetical protein